MEPSKESLEESLLHWTEQLSISPLRNTMLSYVAPSLTDLQARELIGSLLQEQDFSALIRVLQNTQAPHRIASWIGTEFQIPDVVRLYNDPGLSDQFEIKAALALALIERVVPFDRKDQSDVLLINRPISDSIARLMQNVENFSCLIQIEKALENLELSLGAEFIRRFDPVPELLMV